MAQSLDIYIDTTNGNLVAAGSARNGTLPTLTRNDSYNLRVRLQERDTNGFLRDLDLTGSSIKLGIGGIDGDPTDGQFKLVLNSVTSNAISFNATPLQVYTAISGIAGTGVTVTTYGNEPFAYLITSPTLGTAMSYGGDTFTLFPTSSVLVSTRRFPTASVAAQQTIRLVRNPAVYSDTFVASPTAGVVSLTKLQDGSSTNNETYDLAIGSDAEGGSVVLNYGANSTTAIAIGSSATSFAEALSAVTGIGSGNISVDVGNNSGNYSISFVRNLGLRNITTALTLDASGVIFGNFLQTTVTMATAELEELFYEAGTDTITPKLEVELTQSGTPKTVLQTDVTVRRDLITAGSAVPAAQASYLTAAESYAAFVEDINTNVDATNRKLYNSSGQVFLDWQNNSIGTGTTILDLSGTAVTIADGYNLGVGTTTGTKIGVSTASKLAFYGSSAITQPANTNVVSALVNLGLIANTVTVGVVGGSVTFPTVALTGSAITVTDNIPFVFGTTSGSKFGTATGQKISFYNSTPIVQPSSTNVVSALVDLGLIASTVTLGGSTTFPTVALTGSAITVTDNIPFVFGTTNGSKFGTTTSQKISFYNSTPIVQPSSTNVTSALVSLGLIASSVTLGLPTNVVTDWTGNVSATTRFLADSSAVTSVDWGNRVLKTSTGATAVNWETGSFGTGSTVVTIAATNVAISGSYYIAMGTGNGAFRTLSTLASVTFGTLAGNDQHYRDVVVTGAQVNDIVLLGLPSAVSSGIVIQGIVYQANTVCLSATHADTGSVALNTATYRITVLDYQ